LKFKENKWAVSSISHVEGPIASTIMSLISRRVGRGYVQVITGALYCCVQVQGCPTDMPEKGAQGQVRHSLDV
jgi:hypothetical protein